MKWAFYNSFPLHAYSRYLMDSSRCMHIPDISWTPLYMHIPDISWTLLYDTVRSFFIFGKFVHMCLRYSQRSEKQMCFVRFWIEKVQSFLHLIRFFACHHYDKMEELTCPCRNGEHNIQHLCVRRRYKKSFPSMICVSVMVETMLKSRINVCTM